MSKEIEEQNPVKKAFYGLFKWPFLKKYRAPSFVVICLAMVLVVYQNCVGGGGGGVGGESSNVVASSIKSCGSSFQEDFAYINKLNVEAKSASDYEVLVDASSKFITDYSDCASKGSEIETAELGLVKSFLTEAAKKLGVTTGTGTGSTTYTPQTGATFGDFESFRTAVRNGQFVPYSGFNEVYKYGNCGTSTDSWFIFSWGTSSCSASFSVTYLNGNVSGSSYGATDAAIKAKLIEIVNAAPGSAGSFQIISSQRVRFVSGNYIYEYSLGFPAAANPVSRSTISGSSRYDLYDVQSWKL